jgi:hypothetical protein
VNVCEQLPSNDVFLASLNRRDNSRENNSRLMRQLDLNRDIDDDGLLAELHPLVLLAKASSANTPSFREGLSREERTNWIAAMKMEIDSLNAKHAYATVSRSMATKAKANVLGSMWALMRERYPDGRIRYYKARWCPRGDQQREGRVG